MPLLSEDDKSLDTVADYHNTHTRWQRLCCVVDRWFITGFTPAYFTLVMGTGISLNIMYNFPWPAHWLRVCACIMFGVAMFFFCWLTVFLVVATVKRPERRIAFTWDPDVAPYMGCMAMGYMTLVNFIYYLAKPHHRLTLVGIFVLWWILVALSVYTGVIVFFLCYIGKNKYAHKLKHHDLHLTILLPIVTITVALSQGNIFLLDLPRVNLQVLTFIVTFLLWAVAVGVAFMITTINLSRLFIHKLPPTSLVFTLFLPVGFLGQGGYGVALMGYNLHHLIMGLSSDMHSKYMAFMALLENMAVVKEIVATVFILVFSMVDAVLLGLGYFFTALAVFSCVAKLKPFAKTPNSQHVHSRYGFIYFSRAFWAMTFPLGTMSLAQSQLEKNFGPGLMFFKAMGATYAVVLFVITIGCVIGVFCYVFDALRYIMVPRPKHDIV